MDWDYRVVRETYRYSDGTKRETLAIYEVYYEDGEPWSFNRESFGTQREYVEDLWHDAELYLAALHKPFLTLDEVSDYGCQIVNYPEKFVYRLREIKKVIDTGATGPVSEKPQETA